MKTMTTAEIEDRLSITPDQLDKLEQDAANGILHGEPRGEVVTGRPLLPMDSCSHVVPNAPESPHAAPSEHNCPAAAPAGTKR